MQNCGVTKLGSKRIVDHYGHRVVQPGEWRTCVDCKASSIADSVSMLMRYVAIECCSRRGPAQDCPGVFPV